MARHYSEADIDFKAVDIEIAKLVPRKLSLADVLGRLRDRLVEQHGKGVTVEQMHDVLATAGIEVGKRSLKIFLQKGELPGRKVASAMASAEAPGDDGEPF